MHAHYCAHSCEHAHFHHEDNGLMHKKLRSAVQARHCFAARPGETYVYIAIAISYLRKQQPFLAGFCGNNRLDVEWEEPRAVTVQQP